MRLDSFKWHLVSLAQPVLPKLLHLLKGRLLVAVMAILFDQNGQVLLVRHQWNEKWQWRLPGGLVEKEDSLKLNLAREIREELGVRLRSLSLMATERSTCGFRIDVFFLCAAKNQPVIPLHSEVREFRFFLLNKLPKGLFPDQKTVILSAAEQWRENQQHRDVDLVGK